MRSRAVVSLIALVGLVSACAPKTTPLPVAGVLRFPEFVEPVAPADVGNSPAGRQTARAWQFLQAGDLKTAEHEVGVALTLSPGFYPAQAAAAYIALARKDPKGGAAQFGRLTEAHPAYVPALVGKGLSLQALDENALAVVEFRKALELDPTLTDLSRRVDVLTLRGLQDELAKARAAASEGNSDAAIRAYQNALAASPDSPFLYRELASVERASNRPAEAAEHLRRAHELDPGDASSLVSLGDLLDAQGDLPSAVTAYGDALALDPDPAVDAKRRALLARLALAALPEQYRAIDAAAQVSRADLAALIGVRLQGLMQSAPVRDIGVLTDIRGNWAEQWIAAVVRAGLLEALPNHTFQPRAIVRRVDLAQSVAKLLALIAAEQPARGGRWAETRARLADMTESHLAYPAVSTAIAAGVLTPTDTGAFQPTRVVTGAEAIDAIERLRLLATTNPAGTSNRR